MPLITLNCDTIGELDGGSARILINKAFAEAVRDLDDRGQDDLKDRKVQINVIIPPRKGGGADPYVECTVVLPKLRTNSHNAMVRRRDNRSELLFNGDSRLAADQTTIDDYVSPKDKE